MDGRPASAGDEEITYAAAAAPSNRRAGEEAPSTSPGWSEPVRPGRHLSTWTIQNKHERYHHGLPPRSSAAGRLRRGGPSPEPPPLGDRDDDPVLHPGGHRLHHLRGTGQQEVAGR